MARKDQNPPPKGLPKKPTKQMKKRSNKVRSNKPKSAQVHKLNKSKHGHKKHGKKSTKKTTVKTVKREDIFDPNQTLSGKTLEKAVRALVNLQTKGPIHEYDRQIASESGLGRQATANIQNYFNQIQSQGGERQAALDAAGADLRGRVAALGTQTQDQIGRASNALTEPLSQPSSAREQLALLVAQQQSNAARENQALSAQASSQGSNYSQLQQMLQGSSNLRGQQIVGDVNRQIQNNVNTLSSKKSDIIGQIPELTAKSLMDLRETERNYILGAGALGVKRKEATASASGKSAGTSYLKQAGKTYGKLNKQKQRQRLKYLKASGASAEKIAAVKAAYSQAYLAASQNAYGGKGGGGGGKYWKNGPYYKPPAAARAYLNTIAPTPKAVRHGTVVNGVHFSGKKIRQKLKAKLVNNGVHPKLANRVIRGYVGGGKKKKANKKLNKAANAIAANASF